MPDVTVRLEDIDEDNWMDVVLLTTEKDGMPRVCEQYVASNSFSIVQAMYEGTWSIKAVYCGKVAVGFVMYGYNPEYDEYELLRLMIDHKHQGKGFGVVALRLVLDEMREVEDCENVYIAVNKDNERAKRIYQSNGFVKTNLMRGEEEVWICRM